MGVSKHGGYFRGKMIKSAQQAPGATEEQSLGISGTRWGISNGTRAWDGSGREGRQGPCSSAAPRRLRRDLRPVIPVPVLQGLTTMCHHGAVAVGASGHCRVLLLLACGHQLLPTAGLGPLYPVMHPLVYIPKEFKAICGKGTGGINYLIKATADLKGGSSEGKLKINCEGP